MKSQCVHYRARIFQRHLCFRKKISINHWIKYGLKLKTVKKAYGQKYFEFQKSLLNNLKNKPGRRERIDAVVNDIMDAIRSVDPEIT